METVKAGKINIPVIKGETGKAGQIDSISVEMIGTNEGARVDNSGTKTNAKLNFYIPKGTSIEDLSIDEFGDLIATLSNGQTINCGRAKGDKGDTGEAVEKYNVFDWDKKSSDDNPDNINLWQKIYDDIKNGKTVFVFLQENRIYWFEISDISISGKVDAIGRDFGVTSTVSVSNFVRYNTFVNLTIENDIVTASSGFNANANNMMTFLDTNTNYPTPYIPKHPGSPASKKYVDDSITNSLSSISGLTPRIVDVLPSASEASSNIIYLVPDEETTENDLYIEYLFIDGQYEQIGKTSVAGADLSEYAKKDEVPLVYFWDGQNSTQNPDNIVFFQEIVDKHNEGKDILIISMYNNNTFIYNFPASQQVQDSTTIYYLKSNIYLNNNTKTVDYSTNINIKYLQIAIYLESDKKTVNSISIIVSDKSTTNVLNCTSISDNNYFTPTKKSQPVSKGYLDDIIGNINSILDYINGEVVGTEEIVTLQDDILDENKEVIEDVNE